MNLRTFYRFLVGALAVVALFTFYAFKNKDADLVLTPTAEPNDSKPRVVAGMIAEEQGPAGDPDGIRPELMASAEQKIDSQINTWSVPELDVVFKSFSGTRTEYVERSDFAFLDTAEIGDRVRFEIGQFTYSGKVVVAQVSSHASGYTIKLDDSLGRAVFSIDGNGLFEGHIIYSGDTRVLEFKENNLIDQPAIPVEVVSISDILCLPARGSMAEPSTAKVGPSSATSGTALPMLQSIPEAESVLYLDFDGEEVVNANVWESVVVSPHPRANDDEWITTVWQRVAEDFAPFNLNVTTDRSVYDATPEDRRAIAIITPDKEWIEDLNIPGFDDVDDLGGVALIGDFRENSPIAWVFNLTEYYCANTISHEVGHLLGLSHDGRVGATIGVDEYYGGHGTGETSWAPIMGASWDDEGAFFLEEVVQWSKGEYEFANNTEDDLSIIASVANGFGYREDLIADDLNPVPGGLDTGFFRMLVNNQVSASGLIERSNDVDVFQFATDPGLIDLTASSLDVDSNSNEFGADRRGANLAIGLTLYDQTGAVVAVSSDPSSQIDANITTEVDGGIYFLAVSGEGRGANPSVGFSDYASLGQYTISGFIAAPPFTIAGGAKFDQTIPNGDITPSLNDGTDFGFHYPSGGNLNRSFYIENVSGLEISSISAEFSPDSPFSVVEIPASLPGQQTGMMKLAFNPSVTGLFKDTLTITYTGALLTPLTYTFDVEGTSTPGPLTDNYGKKGDYRFDDDFDLNGLKEVWLSDYRGRAIQSDIADWYSFNVSENDVFLVVEMIHDPSLGPLELNLYNNSASELVGVKTTTGGTQTITYIIPDYAVGQFSRFYAQVTSPTLGVITNNAYDLRWRTIQSSVSGDDFYEENDTREEAFNLTDIGAERLTNLVGPGIQNDDDWYRVDVPSDPRIRFLYAECLYDPALGNLGIALYGPGAIGDGLLQISANGDGKETISHLNTVIMADYATNFSPSGNTVVVGVQPGTYYVRVFGDNSGTEYDLVFGAREDDNYEVIDADDEIENDTPADFFDLGNLPNGSQLSDVAGLGINAAYAPGADSENFTNLNDDDWFRFEVDPSVVEQVILDFTDIGGFLGFEIARTNGVVILSSRTRDRDFEFDFETGNFVASGVRLIIEDPAESAYLIRVFALDPVDYLTAYDFRITYSTAPTVPEGVEEDFYEDNERFFEGYDISNARGVPLSALRGFATLTDPDWYRIVIPQNSQNLSIRANFTRADADLTVLLADELGRVGFESFSSQNQETIEWSDPVPGVYYIGINGDYVGTSYNLIWDLERTEDSYEDNNERASAFDLSGYENTWLSKVNGRGVQADEDWFRVVVPSEAAQLEVRTDFDPQEGDIDLEVYNEAGFIVARSVNVVQTESVIVPGIPAGNYYIRIYFGDAGNEYDLWWSAPTPFDLANREEDNYEPNNSLSAAFALETQDQRFLSEIDGVGYQADEDWYSFEIEEGNFGLRFDLEFRHAKGDLDLEIYDAFGALVAISRSVSDNESINYNAPLIPGTYFARIYGSGIATEYDFFWVDYNEDIYEDNDTRSTAFDISTIPNTPLSDAGVPTQGDEDWYRISVGQDESFVSVELDYVHSNGNIDLKLYKDNKSLTEVAASETLGDNESIFEQLAAGDYLIQVFGDNAYNDYDLIWNVFEDDDYEDNDSLGTATDVLGQAGAMLEAAQFDDDWYELSVADANAILFVNLTFLHDAGNIDLELYYLDPIDGPELVASSNSLDDDEEISFEAIETGTYYARVYGDNRNTSYQLIWNAIPDDAFEQNDEFGSASNLSGLEGETQSAIQLDDDWYLVTTGLGDVTLEISLSFLHDEGDLGFQIYDSDNNLLVTVDTDNDGESIIFGSDPNGEAYRLRVFGPGVGTDYTLTWRSSARDVYEGEDSNNSFDSPYDLNDAESTYLSDGAGTATLGDEDWYLITVDGASVVIEAFFQHSQGNIDIELFNTSERRLVGSTSVTDNERIVFDSGSGDFLIRVFGDLNGTPYDLFWNGFTEDDLEEFEVFDNDTRENAVLASANGPAANSMGILDREVELIENLVQLDDDWYLIEVEPGDEVLVIDCEFSHAAGNIDLELERVISDDPLGWTLTATANSTDDNERILVEFPTDGTYLLRVFGSDLANDYSLIWNSTTEDPYEVNNEFDDAFNFGLRYRNEIEGVQFDEDWYRFDIDLNESYRVAVSMFDEDNRGDLNLAVYDENGELIRELTGQGSPWSINVLGESPATYYIKVSGSDIGEDYGLAWRTFVVGFDDAYELNNVIDDAYDLSGNVDTFLSAIEGLAFQGDPDYYRIFVPEHSSHVTLTCLIDGPRESNNLSVALLEANGSEVGSLDVTDSDSELVLDIGPQASEYFILVDGDDLLGYDLKWNFDNIDNYEENDISDDAFDLTPNPFTPTTYDPDVGFDDPILSLVEFDGHATQTNDDWYKLQVPSWEFISYSASGPTLIARRLYKARLFLELEFDHADGDIDVEIFDGDDLVTPVAVGTSVDDGEQVTVFLDPFIPQKEYFIRVYGKGEVDTDNSYNLVWDTSVDDAYEVNNFVEEAYDLTANEQTLLSSLLGFGTQATDDWFAIAVSAGSTNLHVDCLFADADGDINVEIYRLDPVADATGDVRKPVLVAREDSTTDDEVLDVDVSADTDGGIYFIRVFNSNLGTPYDLSWFDDQPTADDSAIIDDYLNGNWSFLPSDQLPSAMLKAPSANQDGDQFPNWAEYALGLDPTAIDYAVLGQSIGEFDGKQYYQFEFLRSKEAVVRGFRFSVRESSDLVFGPEEAVFVRTESIDGDFERVIYRCSKPMVDQPQCFFRLVVDQPELK